MPENISNNTELEEAVQKFEEKQKEHELHGGSSTARPQGAGLVYSLINYSGGIIRSEIQAEVTLFTFSALLIYFSVHMFINTNSKNHSIPVNLPTPYSEGKL